MVTILSRNTAPDPSGRLVDHDIPHPVLPPLPQDTHDFLPRSDAGDLERQDGDGGFDAQELHEPVLLLRLDLAGDVRPGRRGEREGRLVVAGRIRVLVTMVMMSSDAGGALALQSAAHQVWLVLVRRRRGGAEALIVFEAIIYGSPNRQRKDHCQTDYHGGPLTAL